MRKSIRRIELTAARNDRIACEDRCFASRPSEGICARRTSLSFVDSPIIYLFILFRENRRSAQRARYHHRYWRSTRESKRFLSSSPQQFAKLQNAQGYEYATRRPAWEEGREGRREKEREKGKDYVDGGRWV